MSNSHLFEESAKKQESKFFLISFLLSGIGLSFSFYATWHHLKLKAGSGGTNFSCNLNEVVSCDKIATSSYSEFASIPLGVWGIGFFFSLIGILYLTLKSNSLEGRKSAFSFYSLLLFIGTGVSLALGFISSQIVQALCMICLGIYFCNFILLGVFLFYNKGPLVRGVRFSQIWRSSLIATGIVLSVVVVFHFIKPTLISEKSEGKLTSIQSKKEQELPVSLESKGLDISLSTNPYMGRGEDYRLGNDDAPVVIHEFVDFQCPACRVASLAIKNVITEMENKVLLVFRNYPLDMKCNDNIKRPFHQNSCMTAQVARCAGRDGKFWDFHDLAFSEQELSSPEKVREWAEKIGMTKEDVNNCLQDDFVLDKIRDDINLGEELGVTATPSIYVNGQKFEGNFAALKSLIERLSEKTN